LNAQGTPVPLLLAGPSATAVREQSRLLAAELLRNPDAELSQVAWPRLVHPLRQAARAVILAEQREQALKALSALSAGRPEPRLVVGPGRAASGVVLVFPGLGSQWPGMARQLYAQQPAFAAAIDACEKALYPHTQESVGQLLLGPDSEQEQAFSQVERVQPVLFAMAIGLARTWTALGVHPTIVVGHSQGEIAAACVAGLLSLEDAARVVAVRSRLLRTQRGQGSMLMVALPMQKVADKLGGYEGRVGITAVNGPSWTTIGGDAAAVHALLTEWQQQRVFCQQMEVDYVSHGPQVDHLLTDLRSELAGLSPRPATMTMVSTVVGRPIDAAELTADYWVRNLREPVRLDLAVQYLQQMGQQLFLEISANPQLLGPLMELLAEEEGVIGSLKRGHGGLPGLLEAAAELQLEGCELKWEELLRRYPA
jgi:acyl transferase domain-containing protein